MSTYQPAEDRYERVCDDWFRPCGRTGLKLPAISLGCWHNFGAAGTDAARHDKEKDFHENCRRMFFDAFDHGITHFDLANNYGPPPGAAEERVGRILKEFPRDELIISSKAGWPMWPGPYGDLGSRKYLLASLDQSLKRLDLEYVDIFYHHRPDPSTPLEETMGALDQAVRSGKALYAGISSYSGARTRDAMLTCERERLTRPIIHQPSYHMMDRWIEDDLLAQTDQFGLGVIAFCPLAQGVLTNKYLDGIPHDSRAEQASGFLQKDQVTQGVVAQVRQLNELAGKRGQTLAQMALAWTLRERKGGQVTSALIGASRPEQIIENVKAAENTHFSAEELEKIDTILAATATGA